MTATTTMRIGGNADSLVTIHPKNPNSALFHFCRVNSLSMRVPDDVILPGGRQLSIHASIICAPEYPDTTTDPVTPSVFAQYDFSCPLSASRMCSFDFGSVTFNSAPIGIIPRFAVEIRSPVKFVANIQFTFMP
jgi:hypothetical protein